MEIKLTVTEITEIIAEKFGVPPEDVTVDVEEETVGYGLAERVEFIPVAFVDGLDASKVFPRR